MSLSSHLKDKNSPIREFLRTRFSDTRTFLEDARKRVRSADTIRPDIDVPWSTIGTAVDYRIRYYFDVTPHDKLVAYSGAKLLAVGESVDPEDIRAFQRIGDGIVFGRVDDGTDCGDWIAFFDGSNGEWLGKYNADTSDGYSYLSNGRYHHRMPGTISLMEKHLKESGMDVRSMPVISQEGVYQDFFKSLDELTTHRNPVARRLTEVEEDDMNRYCIVLALLEEILRSIDHPSLGPLFEKEHTSAGDLLDIPDAHWIADMRNLSWRFYDNFNHLLSLPHSLNPNFDGSRDIGGADSDLIVNGTLIDIKTRIAQKIRPDWLWQLLGYVLLDYSDHYQINGIGLYMARQGIFLQWDLEEAIRDLCSGSRPSIEELRNECKRIVRATNPALAGDASYGEASGLDRRRA